MTDMTDRLQWLALLTRTAPTREATMTDMADRLQWPALLTRTAPTREAIMTDMTDRLQWLALLTRTAPATASLSAGPPRPSSLCPGTEALPGQPRTESPGAGNA